MSSSSQGLQAVAQVYACFKRMMVNALSIAEQQDPCVFCSWLQRDGLTLDPAIAAEFGVEPTTWTQVQEAAVTADFIQQIIAAWPAIVLADRPVSTHEVESVHSILLVKFADKRVGIQHIKCLLDGGAQPVPDGTLLRLLQQTHHDVLASFYAGLSLDTLYQSGGTADMPALLRQLSQYGETLTGGSAEALAFYAGSRVLLSLWDNCYAAKEQTAEASTIVGGWTSAN